MTTTSLHLMYTPLFVSYRISAVNRLVMTALQCRGASAEPRIARTGGARVCIMNDLDDVYRMGLLWCPAIGAGRPAELFLT